MSIVSNYKFIYPGTVYRVVDGDTVVLGYLDLGFNILWNKVVVRLVDVNTAESRSRDALEKYVGLMSKIAVEQYFIAYGHKVMIASFKLQDKLVDSFGRILADIQSEDAKFSVVDYINSLGLSMPGQKRWNELHDVEKDQLVSQASSFSAYLLKEEPRFKHLVQNAEAVLDDFNKTNQ